MMIHRTLIGVNTATKNSSLKMKPSVLSVQESCVMKYIEVPTNFIYQMKNSHKCSLISLEGAVITGSLFHLVPIAVIIVLNVSKYFVISAQDRITDTSSKMMDFNT